MKKVLKIDCNGYFIEDLILNNNEPVPSNCIDEPCPNGLYKPKWDGAAWIEGLTQVEIDYLKNQPIVPLGIDRLSAVESAISALMGV